MLEHRKGNRVTIVLLNYNGIAYLKNCLDSIHRNTKGDFSLIVVDNASTDGDYSFVSDYPNTEFIPLDKNYGFSYGVNIGIKRANSEFVVLLNNDTEVEEGWLEALVDCISKDEKVFSVCSKMIRLYERELIDDAGDEYCILGWAYKTGDGECVENYTVQREVFSCCGGASIYRRNMFEEIGYFDENFFAYMEDVDLSYRAKIFGYHNLYCPGSLVYHVGSATSGSKYNAFKVRLAARNNVYVPYKNMPFLQLLVNLPFLLSGALIKYLFFSLKGFEKEYREGFIEGMTSLGKIKKVPFRFGNLEHYFMIEVLLIANTFKYIGGKIKRRVLKA